MPRFLLQQENQIQVLCCAFFVLLVVIPGFVYLNFGDSTKKDDNGVLLDNKRWFGSELNDSYIFKNVPHTLFRSIEYQQVKAKSQDDLNTQRRLKDLEKIQELLPKAVSRKNINLNLKPLLLILGHMMRAEEINHPSIAEDVAYIRKETPYHLQSLLEVCFELNKMFATGLSKKKITGKNIETIIKFQQHFV